MEALILWVLGVAALLYGLHRLALWLEARGWLYYWHKKSSGSALGSGFLEVQALFEPGKRHVIEEQRREHHEEAPDGDPPTPWSRADRAEE